MVLNLSLILSANKLSKKNYSVGLNIFQFFRKSFNAILKHTHTLVVLSLASKNHNNKPKGQERKAKSPIMPSEAKCILWRPCPKRKQIGRPGTKVHRKSGMIDFVGTWNHSPWSTWPFNNHRQMDND